MGSCARKNTRKKGSWWDDTFAFRAMEKWVTSTVKQWPDVKFITFGEYGQI